jgi:hypothetical protein
MCILLLLLQHLMKFLGLPPRMLYAIVNSVVVAFIILFTIVWTASTVDEYLFHSDREVSKRVPPVQLDLS